MNVLVTGGMGYIGSHTSIQMINAGMTPVLLIICITASRAY